MQKACKWSEFPKCCKGCEYHDFDSRDDYSPSYYYCTMELILPMKKQSCNRRSPGNSFDMSDDKSEQKP